MIYVFQIFLTETFVGNSPVFKLLYGQHEKGIFQFAFVRACRSNESGRYDPEDSHAQGNPGGWSLVNAHHSSWQVILFG